MGYGITNEAYYSAIANAIRSKVGGNSTYTPSEMASAIAGIPTGGGGGFEYESGTYTPAEDISRPTISFSDQHTTIPTFVIFEDTTTTNPEVASNCGFAYISFEDFHNAVPNDTHTNKRLGLANFLYASSATAISQSVYAITGNTSTTSMYSQLYWIDQDGFRPASDSGSRYWRAGRTYKWSAFWVSVS